MISYLDIQTDSGVFREQLVERLREMRRLLTWFILFFHGCLSRLSSIDMKTWMSLFVLVKAAYLWYLTTNFDAVIFFFFFNTTTMTIELRKCVLVSAALNQWSLLSPSKRYPQFKKIFVRLFIEIRCSFSLLFSRGVLSIT